MALQNNSLLSAGRRDELQLSLGECASLQAMLGGKLRTTEPFVDLMSRFTAIGRIRYEKSKIRQVMLSAKLLRFDTGQIIYQRVGQQRSFHLIVHGTATAWGYEHAGLRGTQQKLIKQLRPNSYFGHSLEMENLEISSVRANQQCFTLQLDLKTMYKVFEGVLQFPQTTQKYNFYRKLILFKDLDKKRILKMVEVTEKRIFLIDNIIYNEGDVPSHLFVMVTGQVELLKRNRGREIPVATVTTYELLGIEDILNHRRYSFTARAKDQSVVIIQIPTEAVLEALDQVSIETKVFEIKEQLRESRISNAVEGKQPVKRISTNGRVTRASFRQKQRFFTQNQPIVLLQGKNNDATIEQIRKTSYLTNKREKFFENEQEFYMDKIRQCETIIKTRYGTSFGSKFYDLFEGYPRNNKKDRIRVQTAKQPNFTRLTTKQSAAKRRSRQSSKASTGGWQFRSFSSQQQNHQSMELPATSLTQMRKRLLDVEDTEKRLTEQFGFL